MSALETGESIGKKVTGIGIAGAVGSSLLGLESLFALSADVTGIGAITRATSRVLKRVFAATT